MRSIALALVLLCVPRTAAAVDEDTIGWWIYAGSTRSLWLSRFLGAETGTNASAAIDRAGRQCGLAPWIDRLDSFEATPIADEPVVFGPFLDRSRAAAALGCVRRSVPGASITQPRHPVD